MKKVVITVDSAADLPKDIAEKYGITEGSYTYEVVMPNPVDDFAMEIIKSPQSSPSVLRCVPSGCLSVYHKASL